MFLNASQSLIIQGFKYRFILLVAMLIVVVGMLGLLTSYLFFFVIDQKNLLNVLQDVLSPFG